jgi:hypothetical protein
MALLGLATAAGNNVVNVVVLGDKLTSTGEETNTLQHSSFLVQRNKHLAALFFPRAALQTPCSTLLSSSA